ncbi:hypothetical protein [Ilumatobacter coccineus]|uniref:Uncharacterized protein n=1 Tax=Ilumatobacter coccineus (strain NBRC 103263 / KCTC 29153 / YM16-304) TaxID=1313172 RepID=A0A6C7EIM6_ILUCY|nr:hypothetical protein [Ilumatobacter coccineus]BAN04388.1 hypothetical protein YM304_40740 [Ilumatobacter coccineus YM16-304]
MNHDDTITDDTAPDDGTEALPPSTDPAWRVVTEAWDPAHGSSGDFELDGSDSVTRAEPGDLIVARGAATSVPLAFVDGTRRVELTMWAEHATTGDRVPGVAGAYAVGAAIVRPNGTAGIAGIRVGRIAIWGGGHTGDIDAPRSKYRWASTPIAALDLESCAAHLQNRMRLAEGDLALHAAANGWNVILDGPLNRIRSPHGNVTGYVKSHHRRLLPPDEHARVPGLGVGERTRVFAAGTDRYTCYMRVGNPAPTTSPWTGIARLEFPTNEGLDAVVARASQFASLIPTYAGVPHRDPRAPVNLTPVRNLEMRLARELGRSSLAERAAREAVAGRTRPTNTPNGQAAS